MIHIQRKEDCCGCNACGDICPKGSISFQTDNEGFWYPEVNQSTCVDCHLCEKACPVINIKDLKKNDFEKPKCYAAIHKNLEIRFDSTSGGAFSALAEAMYGLGGYVGGAIFDENFGVKFFISNKRSDLVHLRSSKYLQSNSEGMYSSVKELLQRGEKVLVCGLPCQIAALKSFLHKDYDNLITVDLICRYINSPYAYRRYLDALEEEYGAKIVYIKDKNKEFGWHQLTQKTIFANSKTYYGTFDIDKFKKASMRLNCLSRPSCYECVFKEFPRIGDITIGDYWTTSNKSVFHDDDTGMSVILLNSKKGTSFFKGIERDITYQEVTLESVLQGNPALLKPLPKSSVSRAEFFNRISSENFFTVVDDMAGQDAISIKTKVKNVLKQLRTELFVSHCRLKPLWQFFYLNFLHPAIKSDITRGRVIFTAPHCVFEISKTSKLQLDGSLMFGKSTFKHSKLETRIIMQDGAKFIIDGNSAFGSGCDVEIFRDAVFETKGGLNADTGVTILCQEKIAIGKGVLIDRNVILKDNNDGHLMSINGYKIKSPIIIGDHCWLQQDVKILSGVKIGDGTIVNVNTVVAQSFPARCVISGSPAKIIQQNVYWKV